MYKNGDINKNVETLKNELMQIGYPEKPNSQIFKSGSPEIFLPIIHYTLLNYSPLVAQFLSDNNYYIFAKNDLDFINSAFKCLIKLFDYKPTLSTKQFFSMTFAEAKVILCCDIIRIVKEKHISLGRNLKNVKQNVYTKKQNNAIGIQKNKEVIKNEINNSPKFNSIKEKINEEEYNNEKYETENENSNVNMNMNNIGINNNESVGNLIINNNSSGNFNFNPQNEFVEIYDSSQEFPLGEKSVFDSSNSNMMVSSKPIMTNTTNSIANNNSGMDFATLVKVISSLSSSVSQMASKVEKFKASMEDRLSKVEAEMSLIKNRQNIIETKLMNNSVNFNSENNNNVNESNEQMFSFACEGGEAIKEMNNNDINNNYKNVREDLETDVNKNAYSYGVGNKYMNNTVNSKSEETAKLIENVEKKFRETRQLLSQFP